MKTINATKKTMLDISANTANLIHTIATTTAIVAALISVSAIVLANMASEVQSKYTDHSAGDAAQAISKANDAAAQSKLKAEALTQQNLELVKKLNAERQERLTIEASLRPRKLTAEAQTAFNALAAELAKKKTTPTVLVNITRNDEEILQFSKQIAVALTKAGVRVQIKKLMSTKDITGTQVVLYSGPGDQAIERAFRNANIASQILHSPQHPRVSIQDQDAPYISAFINVYPKDLSSKDQACAD